MPRDCLSFLRSPPSDATLAAGACVPEDLFERILDFLDITIFEPSRPKKKARKRELAQCACTCRYWAKRCQPRIFEYLTLRSRQDVDDLHSFIESPSSCVSGYIKRLSLVQEGPITSSWIHLVALRLVPLLSLNIHMPVILHISKPAHADPNPRFRSVHNLLPRVYPSFSTHICRLTLSNFHFDSFPDLCNLIGEMRSLIKLDCVQVTWSGDLPETFVVPVCPPSLEKVNMLGCTEGWVGILLLIGRRRRIVKDEKAFEFCLDRNEQLIVSAVLRIMGPNLDSRFFRVEKTECAYNVGCEEISFLLEPVAHRREGKFAAHLKTIVIDIVSIFSNVEDAIVCDWNAFDNCVSRLSHLHKAVLGLYPQEHARLRFIHEVVNTKMVNLGLAAPGKLAYAIYGRDQGEDERTGDNETSDEDTADDQAQVIRIPEIPKWMRVAPGSDELEATAFGDGDLWRVYR